mgnify:CR=1 FL=1
MAFVNYASVYILEYIKPKRPCSTRTSTYCKTKKVMIN